MLPHLGLCPRGLCLELFTIFYLRFSLPKLLHQLAILTFQLSELLRFQRHVLLCFLNRSLLFNLVKLLLALARLESVNELLLFLPLALQASDSLLHAVDLTHQLLKLAVLGLDIFLCPRSSPVCGLRCIFGNLSSLLNQGNKATSNYKFKERNKDGLRERWRRLTWSLVLRDSYFCCQSVLLGLTVFVAVAYSV